ncbi:hypothetical protein FRB99_003910, partial [Tulasnella sp. 403]
LGALDDKVVEDIQGTDVSSRTLGDRVKARTSAPHAEKEATRVSIQQLPLELFTQILHIVLEESDYFFPMLSRSFPWHVEDVLTLSENTPLSIRLTGRVKQLVDILIPHSYRWRSLELVFTNYQEDIVAPLLAATTPSLVDLSLSATNVPWSSYSLGAGGALRSLSVSGTSIAWESPRLSGLTKLCLSDIAYPPTLSSLVDILQASPNLVEVILNTWRKREGTIFYHLASTPTLILPNLSRLSLCHIPLAYTTAILTHIRAPICSETALTLENPFSPDCQLFRSCKSGFASLLSRIITAHNHLDVSIHVSDVKLSAGTDGAFKCGIYDVDASHVLSVIGSFIAALDLKVRLSVELWASTFALGLVSVDVLDLLPPTVESLSIFGDYRHILDYLAYPKQGTARVYEWPCPTLREVRCHFEGYAGESSLVDKDAVLKFLSGRWSKATLPEGVEPDDYTYPRKLANLRFIGFDCMPNQTQAIRGIEGGLIQFM